MSTAPSVGGDGGGTEILTEPAVLAGKILTPPTVKTILVGGFPSVVTGLRAVVVPGAAAPETAYVITATS
tara:strand:+ start:209 stop:418 length:210 start_codon:yes stop_codon:yes gene_type:complete